MTYQYVYPMFKRQPNATAPSLLAGDNCNDGCAHHDEDNDEREPLQLSNSTTNNRRTSVATSDTDNEREYSEYDRLVLNHPLGGEPPSSGVIDRRYSFQMPTHRPYITHHRQYPLSDRFKSDSSMHKRFDQQHRLASIPTTRGVIRHSASPSDEPPIESRRPYQSKLGPSSNSLTVPTPLYSSQSSRTSVYSTSDCSSFMYIPAKPSQMVVQSNPDPSGHLSKQELLYPRRPAPPPPSSSNPNGVTPYSSTLLPPYPPPFQQETQFCIRPGSNLYTSPYNAQNRRTSEDGYSLYSIGTSSSFSYGQNPNVSNYQTLNREKFTHYWLNAVTNSKLSPIRSQPNSNMPPTYEEIEQSNFVTIGGAHIYDQPPNNSLYLCPALVVNGPSSPPMSNEDEEDDDEEEEGTITDFYGYQKRKDTSSSDGSGSTFVKRASPVASSKSSADMANAPSDGNVNNGHGRTRSGHVLSKNTKSVDLKANDSVRDSLSSTKERFARLRSKHFYDIEMSSRPLPSDSLDTLYSSRSFGSSCCTCFKWTILMLAIVILLTILAVTAIVLYNEQNPSNSINLLSYIQKLVPFDEWFSSGNGTVPLNQTDSTVLWHTDNITPTTLLNATLPPNNLTTMPNSTLN